MGVQEKTSIQAWQMKSLQIITLVVVMSSGCMSYTFKDHGGGSYSRILPRGSFSIELSRNRHIEGNIHQFSSPIILVSKIYKGNETNIILRTKWKKVSAFTTNGNRKWQLDVLSLNERSLVILKLENESGNDSDIFEFLANRKISALRWVK